MKDSFFIDSNVCLYAFDRSGVKKGKAIDLFAASGAVVSTQVLMETANVARKKLGLEADRIIKAIDFISSLCKVQSLTRHHVDQALVIHSRYYFSIYDSLIVATSLLAECSILYSEDLQHNQVVEEKLTIINPFL